MLMEVLYIVPWSILFLLYETENKLIASNISKYIIINNRLRNIFIIVNPQVVGKCSCVEWHSMGI